MKDDEHRYDKAEIALKSVGNEEDRPLETPKTIGELYDLAHNRKAGEDKKVAFDYAKVSDELADRIQRKLHRDVRGFVHRIDEQYIRHADDGHDAIGRMAKRPGSHCQIRLRSDGTHCE
ncbi:MAG: hypothetical protein FWE88_05785 [Phycisphaerae bacterium]|nr:hypothetical protein [Phycisphaerae bacterium]